MLTTDSVRLRAQLRTALTNAGAVVVVAAAPLPDDGDGAMAMLHSPFGGKKGAVATAGAHRGLNVEYRVSGRGDCCCRRRPPRCGAAPVPGGPWAPCCRGRGAGRVRCRREVYEAVRSKKAAAAANTFQRRSVD